MDFSVCAYPETALDLLNNTAADVALELQSFGLKGVKSLEAWNERAAFYTEFASSHRGQGDSIFTAPSWTCPGGPTTI
jgi:hypothetical protein